MLKVMIKGKEWTINFRTHKFFVKVHGEEHSDSEALCMGNTRQIDFRSDIFTPEIIRHELMHAFIFETQTTSSGLETSQMEELCCSLIGYHYFDIGQLTEQILEAKLRKKI